MPSLGGSGEYGGDDPSGGYSGGSSGNGADRSASGDPTSKGWGGTIAGGGLGLNDAAQEGIDSATALKIVGKTTVATLLGGFFPGLITGYNSLTKAQKDQAISNVKSVFPGLSDDEAANLAKSYTNKIASTINSKTDGMDSADKEAYITSNMDSIIEDSVSTLNTTDTNETTSATLNAKATIPSDIESGLNDYVTRSNDITNDYSTKAQALWDDYLDFEKTYFDKSEGIQNEFNSNIASIPKMNLKLPDTMGGATLPMAPKVHNAMYADRANTQNNLMNTQANTSLAGMSSRDAINKNMFNVGQTNNTNSLLPTQTALDLYKLERAGQLGLQQVEAGKDNPSTLETWAPTIGTLLTANDSGKTNLESAWDFITNW